MEPGSSIPRSQFLYNSPYPELNQLVLMTISLRSILILSSHLRLGLPKGLSPVGLPVKISRALPSSALPSYSSTFNHADYIRGTVQTIKFLIAKPPTLQFLTHFGPKYSPQISLARVPHFM